MAICKLGAYTDNKVVRYSPLFCPECEFLDGCLKEYNLRKSSAFEMVKDGIMRRRMSEQDRDGRKMTEKLYTHTCLRCGRSWTNELENPKSCRLCHSIFWNNSRIPKPYAHTCLKCKRTWKSRLAHPKACPSCHTENFDIPRIYRTYNCPTSR